MGSEFPAVDAIALARMGHSYKRNQPNLTSWCQKKYLVNKSGTMKEILARRCQCLPQPEMPPIKPRD